ncbi:MAG: hypothetical protein GWN73_11735, partial [Actinobacteria bacterium]|nr:hypothetical protein [Actinomycetota bacterium]NIU66051.1 hypothetical protein [Actinomycetota bacterium]
DPTDPTDPPEPGAIYPYATVGTRCSGGALREFLVLSSEPASCAGHAEAFEVDEPARFVRIPLPGSASFTTTQTLCADGSCESTALSVAFDGSTGSWQGTVGGVARDQSFTATRCS